MAKYLLTLALLFIFGAILVRGEFDKTAAIADFMGKAEECKAEVGAKDGKLFMNFNNLNIIQVWVTKRYYNFEVMSRHFNKIPIKTTPKYRSARDTKFF